MPKRLLRLALVAAMLVASSSGTGAQAPQRTTSVKFPQLSEADAREWLTYLSSDALQGRQVFTEGYGLAAAYIADHLKEWGLKPLGDDGTYFQSVKQHGYKITRNSSVTVIANGETRTFKHGDHVTFPVLSGGKQTLSFSAVEFAGYGLVALNNTPPYDDFAGREVAGKLVVYLPGNPSVVPAPAGRGRVNRANNIIQNRNAAAVIGFSAAAITPPATATPTPAQAAPVTAGRGGAGRGGRGGAAGLPDVTTVQRVDAPVRPSFTADQTFFDFLFSGSGVAFSDLLGQSQRGELLDARTIAANVTIQIDNTFDVTSTELTENVVGMVEGTDPTLRSTYVFFGAHLDHVGYSHAGESKGRANTPVATDPIWNGADDDGSGSTALLTMAKAFGAGPKPKRSVVFVWHAGEEAGLLGSRYMADFPVVPLEKIQAELNIDMIGRNRDNKDSEADTLYVIGADRISTDLHNLMVATNLARTNPLTLNFEFNDPNDPNSFYTRSDHYSYASKGIPIAFFFTGEHPDYHANTDTVDKILFPKLLRIAQMIYELGFNIANSERILEHDNKGPRTGRGFQGTLPRN